MPWTLETNWKPTRLMEFGDSADTSTGVAEVTTDAGRAYVKPMGNRQGPHVLATDWVGTHLARWFGLSTFDVAILDLGPDDVFDLKRGAKAQPGPAFAARAMAGDPWGRSGLQLDLLVNPEDITRLVVFDTWTLNCDRHDGTPGGRGPNVDNVFLSSEGVEPGKRRLIAMDHGLCFIRSGADLTPKLAHIDKVQDPNVRAVSGLPGEASGAYHHRLRHAPAGDGCGNRRGGNRDRSRGLGHRIRHAEGVGGVDLSSGGLRSR